MAKPYKEGRTWSIRVRAQGEDKYLCGFRTARAAEKAAAEHLAAVRQRGRPARLGPERTTVAQALQDAALERLPFMKGARQEADRVNRYLRSAGLAPIVVKPLKQQGTATAPDAAAPEAAGKRGRPANDAPKSVHFTAELGEVDAERRIVPSLAEHRRALMTKTADSDRHRACLAATPMAEVTRHQIQSLIDTMRREGAGAATVDQERSLLRSLFNHARRRWSWATPVDNPATQLAMPRIDNRVERVLGEDEQALLDGALQTCRNALVAPVVTLLVETAMRTSEPLEHAVWGDVDFDGRVMKLGDGKTGSRKVPLSPKALEALRTIRSLADTEPAPDDPVVSITYEALKAAWRRALERAGIQDLRLYDLRHTGATRMALKTGNIFLVQALTGHKTLSQVQRYVNVGVQDVLRVMHDSPAPAVQPGEAVAVEQVARTTERPAAQTQPAPQLSSAASVPAAPLAPPAQAPAEPVVNRVGDARVSHDAEAAPVALDLCLREVTLLEAAPPPPPLRRGTVVSVDFGQRRIA